MSLGPVVSSTTLTEDKVVWSEDLTEWARSHRVHGSWFKIDEDGSWNVLATGGFVEVNVDSFELKIRVSLVCPGGVNAVFIGDNFLQCSICAKEQSQTPTNNNKNHNQKTRTKKMSAMRNNKNAVEDKILVANIWGNNGEREEIGCQVETKK